MITYQGGGRKQLAVFLNYHWSCQEKNILAFCTQRLWVFPEQTQAFGSKWCSPEFIPQKASNNMPFGFSDIWNTDASGWPVRQRQPRYAGTSQVGKNEQQGLYEWEGWWDCSPANLLHWHSKCIFICYNAGSYQHDWTCMFLHLVLYHKWSSLCGICIFISVGALKLIFDWKEVNRLETLTVHKMDNMRSPLN